MHYVIGRDLDADGKYEFIRDMDNMILTEDAGRALQMTETELDYIDMDYLNEAGFYAMEADRFNVPLLAALLFSPLIRGYRPRVAPPPRRRRTRKAPPRSHLLGMFGIPVPPKPPKPRRAPARKPRRAPAPKPRAAAPRGFGIDIGLPKPAGPRHKKASAGLPAGGRAVRPGMGRPGGAGRGGRGPGR